MAELPGGFFPYFDSPVTLVPSYIPHEFLGQLLGAADSLHPLTAAMWNSSLGIMGLGFIIWILSSFKELVRIPLQALGIIWGRIFNFSAIEGFEIGFTPAFEKPEKQTTNEESKPEEQNPEQPHHENEKNRNHLSKIIGERAKQGENGERVEVKDAAWTELVRGKSPLFFKEIGRKTKKKTKVKQSIEATQEFPYAFVHRRRVPSTRKTKPENLRDFFQRIYSLHNIPIEPQLNFWEGLGSAPSTFNSSPEFPKAENLAAKLMDLLA